MNSKEREAVISALVKKDICDIVESHKHKDYSFLDSVLRGESFTPYSKLSDEDLIKEYKEQFGSVYVEVGGSHRKVVV